MGLRPGAVRVGHHPVVHPREHGGARRAEAASTDPIRTPSKPGTSPCDSRAPLLALSRWPFSSFAHSRLPEFLTQLPRPTQPLTRPHSPHPVTLPGPLPPHSSVPSPGRTLIRPPRTWPVPLSGSRLSGQCLGPIWSPRPGLGLSCVLWVVWVAPFGVCGVVVFSTWCCWSQLLVCLRGGLPAGDGGQLTLVVVQFWDKSLDWRHVLARLTDLGRRSDALVQVVVDHDSAGMVLPGLSITRLDQRSSLGCSP